MSKIIYYIGAGASYGKNDARELIGKGTDNERLLIHEGLPVINEIGKCLLSFKEAVVNTPIDTNDYSFLNKFRVGGDNLNHKRNSLIADIEEVYQANKEHATIDTYAKKLYLTRRTNEPKQRMSLLCEQAFMSVCFFVYVNQEIKKRSVISQPHSAQT